MYSLVIRDASVLKARAGPFVLAGGQLGEFVEGVFVDLDAEARTRRQADVAVLVDIEGAADGVLFLVIEKVALVDEEEGHGGDGVEAAGDAEEGVGAVVFTWWIILFGV